jgi:MFS family permease
MKNGHPAKSAWSPLASPVFRALWIANVTSLVGSWMHDVGAAWLMTSLSPEPFMVAMVQTAATLPFCLLSLPAGAIADMVDRRRLLIVTQCWMLAAAAVLGLITVFGRVTPTTLLLFTFALSFGAALNAPAWQAIIPEVVTRENLAPAVALGSVAFNIARSVGPALGGLVVGLAGPGVSFLLNGLSFLGVIVVLFRWKRLPEGSTLPAERFAGAIRTGIRYVKNAPEVMPVLVHTAIFTAFATSLWAFLPIVAREVLRLPALGLGVLFGLFGAGGLAGATALPRMRRTFHLNRLVFAATVVYSLSLAVLAFGRSLLPVSAAMVTAGLAWLVVLSSLVAAIQGVSPSWVRGRVLSVHMLVFFGAMAGGSALWGVVAEAVGVPVTLAINALCLLVGAFPALRYELSLGEDLDLRPAQHWPAATGIEEQDLEAGPVLVVVEYDIDPARVDAFEEAMGGLRTIRRRDGAIRWNLFRNLTEQGRFIESFIVESWVEHLRQHERFTVSDREVEKMVYSFQAGGGRPKVMHFIAEKVGQKKGRG